MERGGDSSDHVAEGTPGGVLKDYIRPKRALRSYATVRFETALPAQLHDWDDPVDTVLAQERCRVCVLR